MSSALSVFCAANDYIIAGMVAQEALNRTFNRRRLISYATGMLGIDMVWATIIAFLPPMLERFGASPLLIGVLLSTAPATGLIVQPLSGLLSDRIRTPLGRRLPFIIIGAPIAVLSLLGLGYSNSLYTAAAFLALLCISVNGYQGPYRAILGDEVAPHQHSLASAFQNIFSGIGLISAFTLGAMLVEINSGFPFFLTALMVCASAAWTCASMRKETVSSASRSEKGESLFDYLRGSRNLQWLFAAQFFWWFAIQAASAFVVLFTVHDLKGIGDINSPEGRAAAADAVFLLAAVTVTVLVVAVPAGLLAQTYGKKLVLGAGLSTMFVGFLIACFAVTEAQTYVLMILFGIGFACVQVIPYTILTQLQPKGREGAFAGLFNVFVALPQLLSVFIVGALIDSLGSYRIAFGIGAPSVLLSILILQAVKLPARKE